MPTSVGNNSVFRSFFEKQKLTGPNFIDWYRQLRLVLLIEDKENYHEHPIPEAHVAPPGHYIDNLERLGQPVSQNLAEGFKKNKPHKAAKGGHGKGKSKMGYAPNNMPFALKPKTPPPPKKDNPTKDAICHQCGEGLRGSKKLKPGALSLYVGDGHHAAIEAIRTYRLELLSGLVIVLNNCHYAPSITRGFILVLHLFHDGFINRFDENNVISVSKNNLVYFMAVPRDGNFEINMSCSNTNDSSMYAIYNKRPKINLDYSLLWHCRLGHISKKRIEKLQHDGLINFIDIESLGKCVSCLSGKMARKPYSHQVERAKDLLGLIHIDVCGPFRIVSRQGANYFVTFTDDFSQNELGKTIKSLRSDRGGEYMSQEFLDHLKEHGIISHRTPPYTPQHNGVSERRNRTLLDMVRFMMSQTTLPKSFWDYALETVARILNMVPTKKVYLRRIPKGTMGYSFYSPSENKVIVAQNAEFFENDLIDLKASGNRMCLYIDAKEQELRDLGEPANYKAALLDPESKKWLDAMNVEMQSMKDNDVWVLVELPPNAKTQRVSLKPNGVDYEETFSPIADIRAIRILIAIAVYYNYELWQMDVKNVFLNGHLSEEVYMEQPEGFVKLKYPNHVCKLNRSIYRLTRASRQWNKRFDDEIKKFSFTQNRDEPCVYQKASGSYVAILILYVNDILLMGNSIPMLQDVKSYLGRSFAMKDLGDAVYILGIKIYRDRSKRLIGLSIGSIMYDVRCTRPDVVFAQNITSQFRQNPGEEHWTAIKNILKYLCNTKNMFLVCGGNMERELRVSCYTDAGYLTDADDLKSQTGYLFILNGGAVNWKSTKQSIFKTSSTDAEYIAAFDASKEAVWIRKFIFGLCIVPTIKEPISMYCDNTGAIAIAKDDGVTKDARHFYVKVYYLGETIKLGDVKIEKVDTDDNLADPFTKALAFPKHSKLTRNIRMFPEKGNSFKPVPQTTVNADGTSTSTIPDSITTKEKAQKNNDVKARSMLLIALPNEHLLTFSQYKDAKTLFEAIQARFSGNDAIKKTQRTLLKQMYENFNAPSTESLDSIFNRLQKIIIQLAILDLDTMSIDDLYNNFKIIEQEVKRTVTTSSSSGSQNMAFLSSPGSTNKVDTANIQVSIVSTPVSTVSSHDNTTNLSDATVYAFLANQPNGSQLVHEDLEKIHEDDQEEIDLKWQLVLLSIRAKRYFQRTSKNITINESDTAGYDKTKIECFNCHKMGHFARKCRSPRNQESRPGIKTAQERLIEFSKSEFDLATYKRGLASVEEQLVFYKKNEVMFCSQINVLKRDASFRDSEINAINLQVEKLKKKKSNQIKIDNFKNASKSLDKLIGSQITDKSKTGLGFTSYNVVAPLPTGLFATLTIDLSNSSLEDFQHPEFTGYRPEDSKSVCVDTSNEIKKAPDALIIEDWVFDIDENESEEMVLKSDNVQRKPEQTNQPRKSGLVPISTARQSFSRAAAPVSAARPINTAASKPLENKVTSVVGKQGINVVKSSTCWVWRPKIIVQDHVSKNSGSYVCKRFDYVDPEGRLNRCSSHMTGNISYLTDFKEHDEGYVTFGGGAKVCLTDVNKKNSVLFTDTGCFVLSPNFKLADESQVLLKVPRKNNMYSFDMKNIVPQKDLTCLLAKVTNDESMLWILVVKSYFKTPYELFKGRPPALSFMRPFGCHVTILNTIDQLGKFDGKSDEGIFVGYSIISKAFRVYSTRTRKVDEHLYITFLENKPMIVGDGPKWLYDIDALSKLMNYAPVPAGTHSNDFEDSDGHNKDKHGPSQASKSDNQEIPNAKRSTKTVNIDGLVNTATPTYADYPSDPPMLDLEDTRIFDDAYDDRDEGAEADYNNLETTLVDLPHGKRAIGTKWVYRYKRDQRGIVVRNKARLVAQGHRQKEGINHDEVFAPVARIEAISVKSASTPMETHKPLSKDAAGTDVDVHLYRVVIGSLMYLTSSRPDIMFATKHIEIRHHFIRDSYEKRLIEMVKIHTDYNVADLLIKAFDVTRGGCPPGRGDSVERAITTDASLEAEQTSDNILKTQITTMPNVDIPQGMDTGGSPSRQEIMGGTSAQTRSEIVIEQPYEPPLSEGHASRSGEGRMEHTVELTDNVPPTPHDSPLTGGYTPGSDEGRLKLEELMGLSTELSNRVSSLENKLSSTKAVYHKAFITLTKKVKKLETQLKQKRSKAVIHSSDEDEPSVHIEDSPKQGRMIEELDKDEDVNLVSQQGEVQKTVAPSKDDDDATLVETLLNIKMSTTKDKGKGIMQKTELPKKIKKREMIQLSLDEDLAQKLYAKKLAKETARQEQEKYNLEKALELQRQLDKRKKDVDKGDQAQKIDWNYPKGGYKQSYFKGMKYEDIRPIFKRKQKLDQQIEEKEEKVEAQANSDQEVEEMKLYMRIVLDEDITIDAIPLATKPSVIVEYKIVKEGKISTNHITRADGSTKRYTSMINLLENINREDLEALWKLVKDKHRNTVEN
nr:hypothetical protein [Tanacetum cinerariifolium]